MLKKPSSGWLVKIKEMDTRIAKKNVLILTSLFFPEISANSVRMTTLAEKLSADGMNVTVVTAFPYYSRTIDSEYKNKFVVKEKNNEINVVHTYTFVPKTNTIYKRLLTFVTYMISSAVYSLFTRENFDIVLSISPPFFSFITALLVSKIRCIPFIIDIQDLYPDTAIELGRLKNPFLIALWRAIEVIIYRRASAIVVISQGFKDEIIKKGFHSDKIFVINSWVNTDKFDPGKMINQKEALGLEDFFVVLFLGTLGYAQGAENIIKTAAMVPEYKRIKFLFIGGGVEKERIIQKARDMKIDNVLFLPPQPFDKIPSLISAADVCLVHLVKRNLYKITIPCKTYEYMAMGKPIIMAVKGDAESLVRDNDCGIVVEPENSESLKRAILALYENPEEAERLGKNSRKASQRYSEEILLPKYKEVVYATLDNGGILNE